MRIIIIRHGESKENVNGKMIGWTNGSLTLRGRFQAFQVGLKLIPKKIDLIISSDLGRALKTSKIISILNFKAFKTDSRLRERNLGILEELTVKEALAYYPEEYNLYRNIEEVNYQIPKGESKTDCYKRTIEVIKELTNKYDDNFNAVLITHHGPIDNVFKYITGINLKTQSKWQIKNCSINEFIADNKENKIVKWGK